MKTTTLRNIVSTARGAELFLPLLTGEQSLVDWATAVSKETVTTKNGFEVSAARSALNGAQFAMTNIAMAMRSATELGVLPYTQAVRETKRIYNMIDALRSAFAGVREEAHRELTFAEITLAVKDGCFDGVQSQTDNEPYTEEELLEMGWDWERIQNFLAEQDEAVHLGQHQLMESEGSMSDDEGEYVTSVHDANQLWDMELKDIKFAESSAAKIALIGKDWPTNHPAWGDLLDRLADSWAAAIEYADDKEAMTAKVARREAAVEDLHAKPMMARWVINHVTRRLFRDLEVLVLKAEDIQSRWDWTEKKAYNEERFGVPAYATRQGMGEANEATRKAYLLYTEMDESELGEHADYARMDHEGVHIRTHHNSAMERVVTSDFETLVHNHEEDTSSQLSRDRLWYSAQLDEIGRLIMRLTPLYKQLRELDLSMSKLWEVFASDTMPSVPPLYWNQQGPIHTLEEAQAAIRIEAAQAKAKAREAEGDALVKAAALVAEMLGL